MTAESKQCSECKRLLPLTSFGKNKYQTSGLQPHCRNCHSQRVKRWTDKNKERKRESSSSYYQKNRARVLAATKARQAKGGALINSLKEGVSCVDCGGIFPPVAMDWHHINGSDKIIGVGQMRGHSEEKIREEIAKCVLICSNCHRVRHFA